MELDVDVSDCNSLDQLWTLLNNTITNVLTPFIPHSVIPVVYLKGRSQLKSTFKERKPYKRA